METESHDLACWFGNRKKRSVTGKLALRAAIRIIGSKSKARRLSGDGDFKLLNKQIWIYSGVIVVC